MRLRDLDAWFLDSVTATGSRMRQESDSVEGAQGVLFQCPLCATGKDVVTDGDRPGHRYVKGAHYIEVLFSNPRGTAPAPPDSGPIAADGSHHRWTMTGTTLDDLTLSPSINCDIPWKDKDGKEHPSSCKFHGYVKNGDVA